MTTECNGGLPPWRSRGEGEGAGGCQQSEWMVAVTEQKDETRGGEGPVDPITVETIANFMRL